MDEYKHILAQLKEQGLGQYVQKDMTNTGG